MNKQQTLPNELRQGEQEAYIAEFLRVSLNYLQDESSAASNIPA